MAVFLVISGRAWSQPGETAPGRGRDVVPFARYVPPSTNVFITIHRLRDVNAALRQAHAWRLLPLLAGAGWEGDTPFDLRTAVNAFLGAQTSITIDDLMATEVGLAASSWSDVANGVWYVRVDSEETLDRWFPKSRRRTVKLSSSARLFRMDDGVVACSCNGVVAMTRTTGGEALMREARRLMAGRSANSLERAAGYRELVAHLPAKSLAVAYIAKGGSTGITGPTSTASAVEPRAEIESGDRDDGRSGRWWENFERAVVGMYAREGRIDFALRGALSAPHSTTPLAPYVAGRLQALPQTTLAAWALTIDLNRAFEPSVTTRPLGRLGRYMRVLAGLRAADGAHPDPLPSLGPHVIVAWGQDMSGAGTPQLAVLVECKQARVLNGEVGRIAERLLALLHARDPVGRESTPAIHLTTHLGVPISYVPLGPYSEKSRFPIARLLGGMEPSWAAHGGWLIIALSRDHLGRILDGKFGLVPTLAGADEARTLWQRGVSRTMLAVLQGGLASQVLERWLADARGGAPSLLNPVSWNGPDLKEAFEPSRLGVAMRSAHEPGAVVVARVYRNTVADGHLRAGDRIIGIDGESLDLGAPNADLRRRWADKSAPQARVLRVRRGDNILDVTLQPGEESPRLSGLLLSPIDAVRELASVGRAISFASLSVHETDRNHFSALLSLRFESVRSPERPIP